MSAVLQNRVAAANDLIVAVAQERPHSLKPVGIILEVKGRAWGAE
jgi:hypothetical protein